MRRNQHNLNHYRLFTCDMGFLVPCSVVEVLPGDTFRHSASALVRVAPLVAPLMHPCQVRIHHWFVPNRLVWDGWEDFITNASVQTFPTVTLTTGNFTLSEHFGIPEVNNLEVSALPFRAYNMIYNEFYRDQDLTTPVGEDQLSLLRAQWEKDYFTTARPNAQQGADTVQLEFGVNAHAPVHGITVDTGDSAGIGAQLPNANSDDVVDGAERSAFVQPTFRPYADLNDLSAGLDINAWREAMARQKWLERRSRFGSRYVDFLRAHGIRPSDGRLDRPEYLGGGKQTIAFSEVLATAEGTSTSVGDLAGHGIAAVRTRPYRRFFEEHGHVISLFSVRPKTVYMDTLHRMWLRRNYDDFWQKEFEMEGHQAVTKGEVYAAAAAPTDVFGYVGRHDDYRKLPSYVSGDFRDSQANFWHYARSFGVEPTLNASFVECAPTDRVYADTSMPELFCMANHSIAARRLVARRSRT